MMNWDKRIQKAEKFLQTAHEHGRKVYARYEDKRDDVATGTKRCNIFYSNVNTLKESLFNSLPRPDISRLHKGDFDDDVSRVAALILQRALSYEVQRAVDFKGAVRAAILDRLVPGVGTVWVRFEQELEEVDGEQVPVQGTERLCVDPVYWEDFLYEPVRTWDKVTWVARKLSLKKSEARAKFGDEIADKLEAVKTSQTTITPNEIVEDKYCVYEIWDKKSKKIIHWAKGVEKPLKEQDDPYKIDGFFPCPKPLIANVTTASFLPVTDYHIAQDQYIQLDTLYARIALIIEAVKVAGAYDASATSLGQMLQGQENTLIPVDNWAMYAERGGAKGMIDWYPVEQVVSVLQQLQSQFENIKAMLYEVTGMSDIVRGASNQYETAAAQQIKAQFASVRLNGYQRDVAEFVAGILRIMADMMVELYSEQKFSAVVGPLSEADAKFAPQAVYLLQNDFLRGCRVDIEADSLVQADWALEKTQRMELMGYVSQFLQSAIPAVQQNPELGKLLLSMLKFSITGFRGSAEIEGIIDQQLDGMMKQAQQPKPPSPEEMKAQAQQQEGQMKMQLAQQEGQLKAQAQQFQLHVEQQRAALDAREKEMEAAHKQRMYEMDVREKELEFAHKQRMYGLDAAIKEVDLEHKKRAE